MKDVSKLLIGSYAHWDLMLHHNQCYLGRCVLWFKNEKDKDFLELNEDEKREFFEIAGEVKSILEVLWQPDRMNYASLANRTNHLHVHIIPRYEKEIDFEGFVFKDTRWGKNYAPYDKTFQISEDLRSKVRDVIRSKLEN